MKKLNAALSAAALISAGLAGSVEARTSRPLSDQEAVRLSYSALQARADQFGIQSAKNELRVRQIARDGLRNTHVRLDQVYRGIPVWGEQLVAHLDANGRLYYVSGTFTPMDHLSLRPKLRANDAIGLAMADFAHGISETPRVELVIFADEGREPVLAYYVRLTDIESDDPASWVYLINAHNGMIEFDYNALETAPATGTGRSLYSGEVEVTTNQLAAGFEMVDSTRGDLTTTDMMNGSAGNGQTYIDADNTWGNGQSNDRASAGVDAHFGAEMTWDYYKNIYGRNGLRDDGRGNLSRVHYSVNYVNAFWSDDCFCMTYGDGDGVYSDELVTLDVAGHEMTHGLTSVTAGLIYSGQSGGLNESMSDIFGTAVEYYATSAGGGEGTPDYWIGEDCWTPNRENDALRYMDDPSKDGISIDHLSKYRPGMDVHYSSGLPNNVFYLAAAGGRNKTSGMSVTPIGREKAEAVFYQALTNYMTPRTNFKQARGYTIQAAQELYGQTEADGIAKAWEACGVK